MERTFSIHTIGCKLNQFESEWIRQALQRREWEFRRFEEGAQFYVINSCTVTGKSDARCRNAVRRARRHTPEAFIIVTGCYAETQPDKLVAMSEVDLVIGNGGKRSLPAIMDEIASGGLPITPTASGAAFHGHEPGAGALLPDRDSEAGVIGCFLDHSRAFVKIQEWCDASCSYCIIPRARGPSRSIPPEAVLEQVSVLSGNGYHEIVLSGIHLGRYGSDLVPRGTLADLVEMLINRTRGIRFRLSSIEVTEVTPRLVELMERGGRLAPHLHVPLQSGDDEVLKAMNRVYDAATFEARIENIARSNAGIGIGTDIIVGFPGETDARHERTVALVRRLPLSYLHVFSFSPRPGTPAAAMPGHVGPRDKKRRSTELIALGRRKKRSFVKAQTGSVQEALIQEPAHRASPFTRTLTGNYCEVFVPSPKDAGGSLAPVRITHYSRGALYGSLVDPGSNPGSGGGEPNR